MFNKHYVVNHCAYLIGIQTDSGNKACAERLTERMFAEIKFTTVRITNPYNSMPGSQVPIIIILLIFVVCFQLRYLGITEATEAGSYEM